MNLTLVAAAQIHAHAPACSSASGEIHADDYRQRRRRRIPTCCNLRFGSTTTARSNYLRLRRICPCNPRSGGQLERQPHLHAAAASASNSTAHRNFLTTWAAFANVSTTFTLPAKFYIDLSYNYQSRIDLGNCWVEPDHRLQAGVKKRFGDQFTASFSVQNLLDQGQVIGAHGDGFVRTMNARQTWSNRSFRIGLTYNFKSGKAFKRKAVEAGSADEKSRL